MAHGASSLSDLSLFVSHELASLGSLEESGRYYLPLCSLYAILDAPFYRTLGQSFCSILKIPGELILL